MAQRYIPEIVDGDKRVLLIAGEVVPYALARIPKPGETRGNLAAGGRGVARPLTARDREIAEALGPKLWARGPAGRRPRRHRAVPDRGQRHQPDLLRRDRRAVGLRRRRRCSPTRLESAPAGDSARTSLRASRASGALLNIARAPATDVPAHAGPPTSTPAGSHGSTPIMIGILIIAHDTLPREPGPRGHARAGHRARRNSRRCRCRRATTR